MNGIQIYFALKIVIGLINAAYWEKRAMANEKLSAVIGKRWVRSIYVTIMIIAAPFVLIFNTIPDLYKRLKRK